MVPQCSLCPVWFCSPLFSASFLDPYPRPQQYQTHVVTTVRRLEKGLPIAPTEVLDQFLLCHP